MNKIIILLLSTVVLLAGESNTYIDRNTGLVWQDNNDVCVVRKAWLDKENCMQCCLGGNQESCADSSGDTAISYCQDLKLGGFDDWRLPTAKELSLLSDKPTLNQGKSKMEGPFWSSTSAVYKGKQREAAYITVFDTKEIYIVTRDKHHKLYVRCVRGNPTQSTAQ